MLEIESLQLEHTPDSIWIHVAYFREVENAEYLKHQLLARNSDFDYAFLKANVITSRNHLFSAVFRAVTAQNNGTLLTPNVHSEIVNSLNPTNNISESYNRFGIDSQTSELIVVKVANSTSAPASDVADGNTRPSSIATHLQSCIKGQAVELKDDDLYARVDWAKVRKYYKLNGLSSADDISQAKKRNQTEHAIIGAIAVKGL